MAELDPLAISSGFNRGEAAYLGDSSFDPVQYAYRAAQESKQRRERDRKEQIDNLTLLDDKIKTQWDADTFNYFQPKREALKGQIMDAFRQTNGRLTPLQKMQFKNAWDDLESEANVSNTLWKDYQDQVSLLDKDTEGKYDRNASAHLLNIWRDPYKNPEAKAEIQNQYGGNINKWRAANAEKFRILPSFSMDQYISEVTKDEKPQTMAIKDDKGNVVYGKHPTGERFFEEETRLSPQQINTLNNRIWSESNYKSDKAKERALNEVSKIFSVNENGEVSFPSDLTEADKVSARYIIKNSGDLRGLTPEETERRLAKGYTAMQLDLKSNQGKKIRDIGFAPNPPKDPNAGKGFDDRYTVAAVQEAPTLGDYRAFNNKYGTNYTADQFKAQKVISGGSGYLAIEPKKGSADTESLQLNINGKQVRPIGFKVENGKVLMTMSESDQVDTGDKDFEGNPIVKTRFVVKNNIPVTKEMQANIAAHYGFSTFDEFENMLTAKAQSLGINTTSVKSQMKQSGIWDQYKR